MGYLGVEQSEGRQRISMTDYLDRSRETVEIRVGDLIYSLLGEQIGSLG